MDNIYFVVRVAKASQTPIWYILHARYTRSRNVLSNGTTRIQKRARMDRTVRIVSVLSRNNHIKWLNNHYIWVNTYDLVSTIYLIMWHNYVHILLLQPRFNSPFMSVRGQPTNQQDHYKPTTLINRKYSLLTHYCICYVYERRRVNSQFNLFLFFQQNHFYIWYSNRIIYRQNDCYMWHLMTIELVNYHFHGSAPGGIWDICVAYNLLLPFIISNRRWRDIYQQ